MRLMRVVGFAGAAAFAGAVQAATILVEAESFKDKGGWAVDQQFMDQMGSPFLLAHGLGSPVADAATSLEVAEAGTYRVWARTRNWVAPWTAKEAPGRFQVLVNGRALGETMAVTFVIGNAHRISASILAPGTTISATIANEFTEAVGDLYTSSLIALGLILFIITFIVLAAARYMLLRIERRIG